MVELPTNCQEPSESGDLALALLFPVDMISLGPMWWVCRWTQAVVDGWGEVVAAVASTSSWVAGGWVPGWWVVVAVGDKGLPKLHLVMTSDVSTLQQVT